MKESWHKLGLLFDAHDRFWWMKSHCQLPCALYIGDAKYRVFFAGRDAEQRSHIGYAEFNINQPEKITYLSEEPVLYPGPAGFFDEHGVYPSSLIEVDGKIYMYFIGWNKGVEQPLFYASIGLAISEDGGKTFERYSKAPIMSRSEYDPCLVTSPNVVFDDGIFKMTYVSGVKWERGENGKLMSFYHIKYAESSDGINWERNGIVAIDFKTGEKNIARPSVIKDGEMYKMWYSYVDPVFGKYRMGYAESTDFKNWIRKDDSSGITVSADSFDSEMICYPNVFEYGENLYMVYNGNNYGMNGFGLAVLKK